MAGEICPESATGVDGVSEFDEYVFRRALRSVHWAFGMVWALNAVGGSPHEKGSAATSPWGLIDGMDTKNGLPLATQGGPTRRIECSRYS
jgi:hypothetical protein